MRIAVVLGLAAIGAIAAAARRVRAAVSPQRPRRAGARPPPEIRALIEHQAIAQGVLPEIALVFAELESDFNPNAYGDRDWAFTHPGEWLATQQRLPDNPAINDPSAWGSYGLFGLLAAYHVQPREHPHVLWDPEWNAQRGVAAVKHALNRAAGDVRGARLLYVGCGLDGSRCSLKYRQRTEALLRNAARRWRAPDTAPPRTSTEAAAPPRPAKAIRSKAAS
jgi:hypothetical protein